MNSIHFLLITSLVFADKYNLVLLICHLSDQVPTDLNLFGAGG